MTDEDRLGSFIKWMLEKFGPNSISGGADIVGKIIETMGRIAEGIATNADPISQTISLGLAVLTINFFLTTEPYKSILDKLRVTALFNAWTHYIAGLIDFAAKELGRDDANGTLGIVVMGFNGLIDASRPTRWYSLEASREAAYLFLQVPGLGIAYGDLAPNGPGARYAKVERTCYDSLNPPNIVACSIAKSISTTAPHDGVLMIPPQGPWVITAFVPQANQRQIISGGYQTQADAQAALLIFQQQYAGSSTSPSDLRVEHG